LFVCLCVLCLLGRWLACLFVCRSHAISLSFVVPTSGLARCFAPSLLTNCIPSFSFSFALQVSSTHATALTCWTQKAAVAR
jgi:hypothetical protein